MKEGDLVKTLKAERLWAVEFGTPEPELGISKPGDVFLVVRVLGTSERYIEVLHPTLGVVRIWSRKLVVVK